MQKCLFLMTRKSNVWDSAGYIYSPNASRYSIFNSDFNRDLVTFGCRSQCELTVNGIQLNSKWHFVGVFLLPFGAGLRNWNGFIAKECEDSWPECAQQCSRACSLAEIVRCRELRAGEAIPERGAASGACTEASRRGAAPCSGAEFRDSGGGNKTHVPTPLIGHSSPIHRQNLVSPDATIPGKYSTAPGIAA